MKKNLVAFTVGDDYLQKGWYAVKRLTTSWHKDGVLYWHVQKRVATMKDYGKAAELSYCLAAKYNVPAFNAINHGEPVTKDELAVLKSRGIKIQD